MTAAGTEIFPVHSLMMESSNVHFWKDPDIAWTIIGSKRKEKPMFPHHISTSVSRSPLSPMLPG